MFLSIIIPVFNEQAVIGRNLEKIISYLKSRTFDWEIIVVDDGSFDQSREIIKKFSIVTLLANDKNQGKGEAVKKGLLAGLGEWLLFLDADLSTDIKELAKFEPFFPDYDIIIGTRRAKETKIIKNQPFYRVWLGRIGNFLIKRLLGFPYKDTQCGFKIFRRSCRTIFSQQTVRGWGFDFEILYLAKKQNWRIKEVGIEWQTSDHTNIKINSYFQTLSELLKIILNIIKKQYD
jgi:dolichyl-phosphate beta-glucosyltransferase